MDKATKRKRPMYVEMDMPTPCLKCGQTFDLNDGQTSNLWFPDTIICQRCGDEEMNTIGRLEEIAEALEKIQNAKLDTKEAEKYLAKLKYKPEEDNIYITL